MGLSRAPRSPKMSLFGWSGRGRGSAIHIVKRNVKKVAAQDAPVSSKTFLTRKDPTLPSPENDVLEVGFGHPEFTIVTIRNLIF